MTVGSPSLSPARSMPARATASGSHSAPSSKLTESGSLCSHCAGCRCHLVKVPNGRGNSYTQNRSATRDLFLTEREGKGGTNREKEGWKRKLRRDRHCSGPCGRDRRRLGSTGPPLRSRRDRLQQRRVVSSQYPILCRFAFDVHTYFPLRNALPDFDYLSSRLVSRTTLSAKRDDDDDSDI